MSDDIPLRKGLASSWVSRARGALAHVVDKAGDVGARAGAAIEPHTPAGRDMRAVALGTKSSATTDAGKHMEVGAYLAAERTRNAAHALEAKVRPDVAAARMQALSRGGPIHRRTTLKDEHAYDNARAFGDQYAAKGATEHRQRAIASHHAAYARMGRNAARFGFKAGLAAAGVGAAGGAAAALTQAQHEERVKAAKVRWSASKGKP